MNRLIKLSLRSHRGMQKALFANNITITQQSIRCMARGVADKQLDPTKPVPYFSSGLYKEAGIHYDHEEELKNKKFSRAVITSGSIAVFLIYFCILRGDSEVDEILGADFFEQFGPQAVELKKQYQYNIKHNLPVGDIVNQLDAAGVPRAFQPQRIYDPVSPPAIEEEK